MTMNVLTEDRRPNEDPFPPFLLDRAISSPPRREYRKGNLHAKEQAPDVSTACMLLMGCGIL